MRKLILVFSILAVVAAAIAAPAALAYTHGQAVEQSKLDAELKWGGSASVKECVNSGKNERNVAQWYCNGHLILSGEEWKINLDPYGTITYEHR